MLNYLGLHCYFFILNKLENKWGKAFRTYIFLNIIQIDNYNVRVVSSKSFNQLGKCITITHG